MAGGYIDLFRKLWGWLAVDAGEAPAEVGAQMCVAAVGVYRPASEAENGMFAVCSARTANHSALAAVPATWSITSPVGSHVPGMKSAKGFGCA